MTVLTSAGNTHASLVNLLALYLRGRQLGGMGSNQRERIRNESLLEGFRVGLSEAMALMLTDERAKVYPHLRHFEAINVWDFAELLQEGLHEYQTADREDKERILNRLHSDLVNKVFNDNLKKHNDEVRRTKILQGDLEPTEEDLDWLKALQEDVAQKATMYDDYVRKIEAKGKTS